MALWRSSPPNDLGLGLGLGLGGFGGELRVRASIRVRVSKLGGELLYQRPKIWSGGTYTLIHPHYQGRINHLVGPTNTTASGPYWEARCRREREVGEGCPCPLPCQLWVSGERCISYPASV